MTQGKFFVALLAGVLSLTASKVAGAACLNGHPSLAREYASSLYVVTGRAVSEHRVEASADRYFLDGNEATVRVGRVFKGAPGSFLQIFSENSSGRFPMAKGVIYLLFIYSEHGRLLVDNCGSSGLVSQSATAIHALMAKLHS